jgi:hypothetical protein
MPIFVGGLAGRAPHECSVQSMARPRLSAGLTAPSRAAPVFGTLLSGTLLSGTLLSGTLLFGTLLAAATALSGCAGHLADSVPAMVGGLPEKIPSRPETPPEFPAVHDQPAARAEGLLNEAERKKLKDDLAASRDRATRLGLAPEEAAKKTVADPSAKKKVAEPAAKKKKSEPPATGSVSAAGAAPKP